MSPENVDARPAVVRPFEKHKATQYMAKQIDALKYEKTQREIAAEVGYEKPNMISMMKRGEVRIPQDKVLPLARALKVDPGHFLRLILLDQNPALRDVIDKVFGGIFTANQKAWMKAVQDISGDDDLPELTDELREKLASVIKPALVEAARRAR